MSDWQDLVLSKLALRQKIAQMISVRVLSNYQSADSDSFQKIAHLVRDVGIGGIIFFQGTVPGQAFYANRLQELAQVPLLVAQDAENGIGMRLTDATVLPHMMAVGATGDPVDAYRTAAITAREARALGVHHVFAPVADVNTNPHNPIINTRSFGSDPRAVASLVVESTRGLQDNRVLATVKHFPGHGDTAIDTHLDLATLEVDRARLDDVELVPFKAAFEAGVRSCMVGHLSVPSIDPSGVPASLSRPIVTGLLREELGFDGLVVTDALDMNAITNAYGSGEAAVMAVIAGVDMLLLVSDELEAVDAIEAAVLSGRISARQIDASVGRILVEKEWCGLDGNVAVSMEQAFSIVSCTEHNQTALSIASSAVCSMGDALEVSALRRDGRHMIVSIVDDNFSPLGHSFVEELNGYNCECVVIHPGMSQERIESVVASVTDFDRIIVTVYLAVRSYSGKISFPPAILSAINDLASDPNNTVVLFGSPYVFSVIRTECPCVATCSTSPASEIAAAKFLIRGGVGPGSLPIRL